LVGPNGSGKSSFLRALDLFYTPNARYTEEDFYAADTSQPIVITLEFADLTQEEKVLFQRYVEGGRLTVQKEMRWPLARDNQKYYGTSLQNPDFDTFRSASGSNLRREYDRLRGQDNYKSLPIYENREQAERALQEWEQSNPNKCVRRRDAGQFFGFREVGEAHLERHTRFLFVPAVREASEDATEGRGRAFSDLMDLVVRKTLAQRTEVKQLQEEAQRRYKEIMEPSRLTELQGLGQTLTSTLQIFVPDARVDLTWDKDIGVEIPMPRADVRLVEDGYPSAVDHTGHGLQRAFILTILQHLAAAESLETTNVDSTSPQGQEAPPSLPVMPNIIIGIEEPELYQHPSRQRHLSKVLLQLSREGIKGVADRAQIIYSTHSPLFVDIERFDCIRLFRKEIAEHDKPRQTRISQTTLDRVAAIVEKADGKPPGTYSAGTLRPRLQALMTPSVNEGFFAKLVVLVEGEEDRAAILGVAASLGYDLESQGISVIPCGGKTCLDRPAAIFRSLGIPIYAIWDSDFGKKDAKPEDNHRLLTLFNEPIQDWPEAVEDRFACFKRNLSHTLKEEIGHQLFDDCLNHCCQKLDFMEKEHALKSPKIIRAVLQKAAERGKSSKTLQSIVNQICRQSSVALRPQTMLRS
jgi:hypothetical protein